MKRIVVLFLSFSTALLLWSAPVVRAQESAGAQPAFVLHSLSAAPRGGTLVVDAFVAVRNVSSIQPDLIAGSLLDLRIHADLEARRVLLPNPTLALAELSYQIRFDPVSREFVLLRPNLPPLRQRGLSDLLAAALSDVSLALPLEESLEPGKYRASLTLGLRQAAIPPMIEKTLFFWPWQVISPTTFSLDFTYEADQTR